MEDLKINDCIKSPCYVMGKDGAISKDWNYGKVEFVYSQNKFLCLLATPEGTVIEKIYTREGIIKVVGDYKNLSVKAIDKLLRPW